MNYQIYEKYLYQYLLDAYKNSDGSTKGVSEMLHALPKPGRFSSNRAEKIKAIDTAITAFDEHRHWPIDIVFSHLGVDFKKIREEI